ncbi:unnamed protein product, partial [Ectocarpus sp. 4 AP-2014]
MLSKRPDYIKTTRCASLRRRTPQHRIKGISGTKGRAGTAAAAAYDETRSPTTPKITNTMRRQAWPPVLVSLPPHPLCPRTCLWNPAGARIPSCSHPWAGKVWTMPRFCHTHRRCCR